MDRTLPIIAIALSSALLGGCAITPGVKQPGITESACSTIQVADDLSAYERLAVPEQQFVGILEDSGPSSVATTRMRYSRYSVSGRALSPTTKELTDYVGQQILVIGKKVRFELEGEWVDEIHAKNVTCQNK